MVGAISGGQVVADFREPGNALKELAVLLQMPELCCREAHFVCQLFVALSKLQQALGVREREGTQKDTIDDGEDGGVGSDAEGEGQNSDYGEARGFGEYAEAVAEVVPEGSHGSPHGLQSLAGDAELASLALGRYGAATEKFPEEGIVNQVAVRLRAQRVG